MKLVMDEKLKHRLIGLAVIFSLGAIFAPAIMKKSNQNLEHRVNVEVTLPPKPNAPQVAVSNEEELFKTITIAKAKIKSLPETSQLPELAKAEPLSPVAKSNLEDKINPVHLAINEAATGSVKKMMDEVQVSNPPKVAVQPTVVKNPVKPASKIIKVAVKQPPKVAAKVIKVAKVAKVSQAPKKEVYALQLASFSQLANAKSLVSKLGAKGYKASLVRSQTRAGSIYKVYVGHSVSRPEVMKLKSQLASAMQLNGFVVNTGVS